jgi:SAM-dependent methyltransferase
MNAEGSAAETPRWGKEGRDRKAVAILGTLVSACGEDIRRGLWLDVGCGSGGIASALAPNVERMVGVDPEPWPDWAPMAEQHANLSFTVAAFDDPQLPMPENTVDVVICNQVYEHVARPEQLIRNIHRVLRPGGVCYFAGPNLLWPIEPHVHWPLVHWLPRGLALSAMRALGSRRSGDLDAFSTTAWTLERWVRASGMDLRSAIADRLAAQPGGSLADRSARLLARLPRWWLEFANPTLPGFVYLLRKPCGA